MNGQQFQRRGRIDAWKLFGQLMRDTPIFVHNLRRDHQGKAFAPLCVENRVRRSREEYTALPKPTAVGGAGEARQEARPNGVTRWIVSLKQAGCIDPDPPLDQRRDMYIVIDRVAGGEQERWARARLLNIATHEVHLIEFTPGEKTLTLKGTVLFHSDRWVSPSSQRPGVVAMDVELTLDRDGENWKGTYKGVYGSQWTGSGRIVGPK